MTARTTDRRPAGADDRARQSRGTARKEQILAEAIEMLATRGYRGTSIADLAERVGLTHPGLLYYFGSKERLLREVVETREATERAGYLSQHDDDASIFQLGDVARFAVETAVLTRLYAVLATENLDADDPLHGFFVERYAYARRLVVAVLARDQERGDVRADLDLEQLGAEVIATLMGLEVQWLMDPDRIDLVAIVDGYVDGLRLRLAP